MNKITKSWNIHRKVVITGAQIVTILTLLSGIIVNYSTNNQNKDDIATSSQWMKDAIKQQNQEIKQLQIDNAVLKVEYEDLKEDVNSELKK
jgi:hypothetical protein